MPGELLKSTEVEFYCPACSRPVPDPLQCGDCTAIICRECGSPLERIDELGIG
ncbi:MAG: hypothetical protein ABJF23_26225 [Bryobacteraceae bacterium]